MREFLRNLTSSLEKRVWQEMGFEIFDMDEGEDDKIEEGPEEEIKQLMEDHDIDEDTAEKAQELIDEGLDEDEAVELADEL